MQVYIYFIEPTDTKTYGISKYILSRDEYDIYWRWMYFISFHKSVDEAVQRCQMKNYVPYNISSHVLKIFTPFEEKHLNSSE